MTDPRPLSTIVGHALALLRAFRSDQADREYAEAHKLVVWTRILALTTLAAAIFSLLGAGFLAAQLIDGRNSFVAENRAWLMPEAPVIQAVKGSSQDIYAVSINWRNVGKSPAESVQSFLRHSLTIANVDKLKTYNILDVKVPPNPTCDLARKTRPSGPTWPSQELRGGDSKPPQPISPRLFEDGHVLVVQGCLVYFTFATGHVSKFCYMTPTGPDILTSPGWQFCVDTEQNQSD